MLEMSGAFMLLTLAVFIGYVVLASATRDHISMRPRVMTWIRRTFATAFVALAARLVVSDR